MKTRDQRKKSRLGLGVMAIIVCLSPVVPLIAGECRKILQMRQFECHVIEGVGTRDAKRVTVRRNDISFSKSEWRGNEIYV